VQNLLSEHLQEQEGMEKVATIDRPFSDERTMSRFEKDAENAAFLARIKAATREVILLPLISGQVRAGWPVLAPSTFFCIACDASCLQ